MKRVVVIFGLISGLISSAMMFLTLPLFRRGIIGNDNAEVIGYTSILLSLLLVFFGIRSYRESHGGGTISFGRGLAVGMLITLISCAFYVASWEVIYFNFMPDFVDNYAKYTGEKMRASGASDAAVAAKVNEVRKMKPLYDNPLTNAALTFLEPFPVGLIITLISAALLRKRGPATALA